MEFLVTMTTRVPDGVSKDEVNDVRAREAEHTGELAATGRVLRLWRPPLEPGEWRTIGLFDADDRASLDHVLRSMPLRIWRTDVVESLSPHPNDPGRGTVAIDSAASEFLTILRLTTPPGIDPDTMATITAQEARRTAELAAAGVLIRLWRLSDEGETDKGENLGHWQADD